MTKTSTKKKVTKDTNKKTKTKTQAKSISGVVENARDVGRYHRLAWGGGQITVPSELAEKLPLENMDKLFIELKNDVIMISKLN